MSKIWPVFLGVAVVMVFSIYPIRYANFLCCLGLVVGGIQGVVLTARMQDLKIEVTHAMRIGIYVGVFSAIVIFLANVVVSFLFSFPDAALDPIPQFGSTFLLGLSEGVFSIAGDAPSLTVDGGPGHLGRFLFQIPVNALFGGIGGAIGASLFREETPISG